MSTYARIPVIIAKYFNDFITIRGVAENTVCTRVGKRFPRGARERSSERERNERKEDKRARVSRTHSLTQRHMGVI